MFAQLGEVAPKALVVGGIAWAAVNWAFLGPELGARTIRADGHLEICKQGYGQNILATAEEEARQIPVPTADPQKEIAANSLRNLMNSPLGQLMKQTTQQTGLGVDLDDAMGVYQAQKQQAAEAYAAAVEEVKRKTTTKLGKAGDFCGCVADEAVSQAQNDFAIYSGTLTLFEPNGIKDLNKLMLRAQANGVCDHLHGNG